MSPSEQVVTALARLDPESRALLELSWRRRLSDEEIAGLIRAEPSEVAERRDEAERRLGLAEPELREQLSRLDDEHWKGQANGNGRPPTAKRHLARPLVGAALVVAGVIVGVILLTSGGSDESGGNSKSQPQTPAKTKSSPAKSGGGAAQSAPAPRSAGPVLTMQRLNSTYGRGTAQLITTDGRPRLRLRLSSFLKPNGGGYAVWLFNSPDDARRLYATSDTAIQTDLRLPRDYKRFTYVDVARAVPSLNSSHSGLSLLRVRIADLNR